jgi:plastocyanin
MKLSALLSAAVLSVSLGGLAGADVTGKVTFDGKAPAMKKIAMNAIAQCAQLHAEPVLEETVVVGKDNALANVVVSVKNPPAGGKLPAEPAVFDQKGCQYIPHVLPVMVGQKITIKNSDPFLHNVHGLPETNAGFNFGQVNAGDKTIDPMKAAEAFRVKCDVHPWMGAWFVAFEHPYFGVTGADGTFSIKGLPDGDYDLEFWHEKLGTRDGKVSVKGGKGEVTMAIKPEADADATPAGKTVRFVSLTTGGDKSCCTKEQTAALAKK